MIVSLGRQKLQLRIASLLSSSTAADCRNRFRNGTTAERTLADYIRAPQKGPEKWCRAKIVKSVENFLTFLTIFNVFLPCAKIVEKCRKTF